MMLQLRRAVISGTFLLALIHSATLAAGLSESGEQERPGGSVPDVYSVFEKRAKEEKAIAADPRVHHKYSGKH
jgi:hypothetical protein